MNPSGIGNIIVGLALLAWILYRQIRINPIRQESSMRIFLIMGVVGLIETINAIKDKGNGKIVTMALVWILLSLIFAAAFGYVRASSVKIWRDKNGQLVSRGTCITMILWLVAIAVHFGFETLIDKSSHISSLGGVTILLYLAITLGVQREIIRLRADKQVNESKPATT